MALVPRDASNNSGRSQHQVGMPVADPACLAEGVYVRAIEPLETIVDNVDLTSEQRLNELQEKATWVKALHSSIAHVSEVALLFFVTAAYSVLKDFKGTRPSAYALVYKDKIPWSVACTICCPGKTSVLGMGLTEGGRLR
jgi:hypothetical protein